MRVYTHGKQPNAESHIDSTRVFDDGALNVTVRPMTHTLIGYARCSTDKQDLAAQHDALLKLGVAAASPSTPWALVAFIRMLTPRSPRYCYAS